MMTMNEGRCEGCDRHVIEKEGRRREVFAIVSAVSVLNISDAPFSGGRLSFITPRTLEPIL
jgi:hypothetical protein